MMPPARRRRPHIKGGTRFEETVWLVLVIGGLLLLGISYRAFHKKSAERIDALQQLRAAKQGRTAAAAAGGSGGFLGGRRSGVGLGSAAAEGVGQGGAVNEERRHVMPSNLSEEGAANQQGGGQSELQRYCEEHFGLEWVRRWGAAARQVCSASQQLLLDGAAGSAGSGSPSAVTCRSMTDPHMPAASAPHVLCDATNLRLDPAKLRRARCPLHRPGYLCRSPTYHHYQRGAWSVNCSWPSFSLQAFSKDHQQDIFESMLAQPDGTSSDGSSKGQVGAAAAAASIEEIEEVPTLLVTREITEHANVFHTLTDLLNVYITLVLLGWEGQARQVVMLDSHPPGPLDVLWPVAAAGGGTAALAAVRLARQQQGGGSSSGSRSHPWDVAMQSGGSGAGGGTTPLVRRVEDVPGPVLFRHAAFVPPGYASLLFAHLYEDSSCPLPTDLFAGFRRFLLSCFGLQPEQPEAGGAAGMVGAAGAAAGADGSNGRGSSGSREGDAGGGSLDSSSMDGASSGDVLTIRLISRRPSAKKRKMARQIGNEAQLVQALSELGGTGSSSSGSSDDDSGGSSDGGDGSAGAGGSSGIAVAVSLLDFAELQVEEQFAVVQQTDVLIGMHGAALAHALLLPPHAALVELWPEAAGIWRCYQNMAQWAGALYRRVANADPSRHRQTPSGDVTEVDATEVTRVVAELLPLVRQRRQQEQRRQQQQQQESQEL